MREELRCDTHRFGCVYEWGRSDQFDMGQTTS